MCQQAKGDLKIERAPAGKGEVLAQRSILVVEDEVLIRLHLAEELRDAGYTVVEAADGHEAMKLLTSLNEIGLLLTDIRMPGSVDGIDLARWVRGKFPEIKIVLVSAEYYPETFAEFDAGFTKPIRMNELMRRVRQLLPQAEHGS
ncbi:response regulator [Hyphomicrobium sp. 99]|uniref:response regulator n=1 Tax=Hyphomicrobium sp. 99 TaxID=1163419 RepID=UPI00069739A3|nr:response regulator [Hyphomicrobium sp. 99]